MVMHSTRVSFRLRTRKDITALCNQKMAQKIQKAQLKEKEEHWAREKRELEQNNMILKQHGYNLEQQLYTAQKTIQHLELDLERSERDLIKEKTLADETREFYILDQRKAIRWHVQRTEERMEESVKKAEENLKAEVEKSRIFEKRVVMLEEDLSKLQQANPEALIHVPTFAHCQICNIDYNELPDRVPRVLECGHSVCTLCASQIAGSSVIKCPFDRTPTTFQGEGVTSLPKNFTILEMMEKGYKS